MKDKRFHIIPKFGKHKHKASADCKCKPVQIQGNQKKFGKWFSHSSGVDQAGKWDIQEEDV